MKCPECDIEFRGNAYRSVSQGKSTNMRQCPNGHAFIEPSRVIKKKKSNWRPIDTAPTDGRDVLIINQFRERAVAYWIEGNGWCISATEGEYLQNPVYWQPLPDPPTEEE